MKRLFIKTFGSLRPHKQDTIFLGLVILLAIGFRFYLMNFRFCINFDEVNYLKLGVSGAKYGFTHVLHPFWSPFLPFVIALFARVISNYELAGRMVSLLCGSLILIPVFLFTKHHFNRKNAWSTILFLAFYPSMAFFQTTVLTGSIYTLNLTIGIFIGWILLHSRSILWAVLGGVVFGCSYLTRPEGIGLLLVFIGIMLFVLFYTVRFKKDLLILMKMSICIVSFIVIATPYLIYLHRETGLWTLSAKGESLQQGETYAMTRKNDEGDRFRMLSEDNKVLIVDQIWHLGNFVKSQHQNKTVAVRVTPNLFVRKYINNVYQILKDVIPRVLTTPIFVLLILGLFGIPWTRKRGTVNLYLLSYIFFFYFVLIPAFHINERYFLPFLPILFIWVGQGLECLTDWLQRTINHFTKNRHNKIVPVIILCTLMFSVFIPRFMKIVLRNPNSPDYLADPVEQKKGGLWLKENSEKIPIIMSRSHVVDFYAGNYSIHQSVSIPQNSLERIRQYAKHRSVDYLVVNERYKKDYLQISYLLEENSVPEGLELVYKDCTKAGLKTVIYRFMWE